MIINRPALIRTDFFSIALIIILLVFLFTLVGCHNFFKPVTANTRNEEEKASTLNENLQRGKYFILRHPSGNFAMRDIQIDQKAQTITFLPEALPVNHQVYTTLANSKLQYRNSLGQKIVLTEVHLFSRGTQIVQLGKKVTLPLNAIEKIQVIEVDSGRTTSSYILGGLGYTLGVFAVLMVIAALTKSSCPFVSAYNGDVFELQGELFGGALYPSSERADYVPLKIRPVNGEYTIRISNELQERQYTNFAKLLVVSHDNHVRALTDLQGKIHTIGTTIPPIKAVVNDRQNVTASVAVQDIQFCAFDDTSSKDNINSLILTFNRPAAEKKAKLVLQLRNSYWFDYLYGEFNKHFGGYYNKWMKKQSKVPAIEHDKWTNEQNIPLQVFIKVENSWKQIASIKTTGPLMNREMLIPIDLPEGNTKELQVKLTTGFMFWELDYAGIDYSADQPYILHTLDPYEAVDENGKNVVSSLRDDDNSYLDQPYPGKVATLRYKIPVDDNKSSSVILYTKGYYQPIREYKGLPDLAFLKKFRSPGAFAAFSRQRFETLKKQNLFAVNQQ